MSPHTALFLAGLFLRADTASGSGNLLKMLHSKSMLQPLIMQMILGASLDRSIDQALNQVPNKTCSRHLREYADGVKMTQLWALKMIDSSTKILEGIFTGLHYHLGNYDECVKVKDIPSVSGTFSGQYCLVEICVSDTLICTNRPMEAGKKMGHIMEDIESSGGNLSLRDILPRYVEVLKITINRVAMCVPSTCTAVDIETFLNAVLFQVSNLVRIRVVDQDCHTAEGHPLNALDLFTIVLLLLLGALTAWSTVYDLQHQNPSDRNELYTAFSAHTNLKRLTNTSVDKDSLHCLHGIRFFSICWVVMGHRFMKESGVPLTNMNDAIAFIGSLHNLLITNGVLAVDTFFVLSGLLVSYVALNSLVSRTSFNMRAFYLHRYIRLTPALAIMVLLESSLLSKLGDGPLWDAYQQNDCGSSWWYTLLYLKNYNMPSLCVTHSWYLSADTQLYFLSPLLLIPLWKNPRIGHRLLAVAIFLSWIIPFTQAYVEELIIPITYFADDNEVVKSRTRLYFPTHNRFAPWLLGLWLGYTLHRIRIGQQKVRLSKVMVAVMWLFIIATLMGCMLSTYPYVQVGHQYSRFRESFDNSTFHLMWGLAVSLIIFACVTGHGGPINSLLSLGIWQPGSRLTYGIYLVHVAIQTSTTNNLRTRHFFNEYTAYYKFLGDMVLSLIAATVMSLMFESPLIIIEKIIIQKEKNKRLQANKVMAANTQEYSLLRGKAEENHYP